MRQIGGSIGIAVFATLLTRAQVTARHGLVAHLNPGRPELLERLASARQLFGMRGGLDLTSARSGANAILNFVVSRQALVLAFEKMFLLAGIVFLLALPLLFFLKTPPRVPQKVNVHVDM